MSKRIKKMLLLSVLVFAVLVVPVAYAAVSGEGWNVDNLKATNLPDRPVSDIMLTFIEWAIIIIGLLCICVFIYAGFLYLTAQGETDKIETAKKVMIYAVIGVAVAVLGYVAVKTVNDILVGNATPGGGQTGAPTDSAAPAAPAQGPGGPAPAGPGGTSAPLPVAPGM